MRSGNRVRIGGLIAGVALFAALIGYLLRAGGGGELALERARPGVAVAALFVLLTSYAAQASAWHALVRATGEAQPPAVDAGRWCVSILGKYVPGKVFNAIGRLYLYRGSVTGTAGMAAAYAAESLLTASAAACVAAFALWLVRDAVPPLALFASTLAAVGGVAVAFSTLFDRAAGWVAARVLHTPPPAPIAVRDRVLPFALQLASYGLMGGGLYVLVRAWPLDSAVPAAAVVGALCLSGIAGMAAFVVPTGIGVREGVLAWLLASFASPASAAWIAIASRVWLTAGDAIAVAVGALLLKLRARD